MIMMILLSSPSFTQQVREGTDEKMNENKFCRHETCKTYWVKYLVLFYLIYVSYHLQPPNSLSFIIALSVCVVSKILIYFYIYDLTIQSTLVAQPAGDFTTFPASTCSTAGTG